jgi:DNA-binding MarR family transcriptional regulator
MRAPGSSDELVDELFVTTHRLRTYVDARLRANGASIARLRALRMLAAAEADAEAAEPLRMRDLSEALGISARTATTVVDSLEREGLVERAPHPTDRRSVLLSLTDSGRVRHREAEKVDRVALAEVTSRLGPEERERLRELLGLIREVVG